MYTLYETPTPLRACDMNRVVEITTRLYENDLRILLICEQQLERWWKKHLQFLNERRIIFASTVVELDKMRLHIFNSYEKAFELYRTHSPLHGYGRVQALGLKDIQSAFTVLTRLFELTQRIPARKPEPDTEQIGDTYDQLRQIHLDRQSYARTAAIVARGMSIWHGSARELR